MGLWRLRAAGTYRVKVDIRRDEGHELAAVKARLQARFTQVPESTVGSLVEEIYADLSGPVRAYVPVLVEHLARDRLTSHPKAHS